MMTAVNKILMEKMNCLKKKYLYVKLALYQYLIRLENKRSVIMPFLLQGSNHSIKGRQLPLLTCG